MRSPLILQFQMMFMHRHQALPLRKHQKVAMNAFLSLQTLGPKPLNPLQAARPPPYVYLSDGGLIECLGVLMLLRRFCHAGVGIITNSIPS